MVALIGKEFKFDSAHYLPNHPKCGNVHGHTWTVTAMVEGSVKESGMVLDFNILSNAMKDILSEFDHKILNELPHFKDRPPTAEELASYIGLKLSFELYPRLESGDKLIVRVKEGDGGWAQVSTRI